MELINEVYVKELLNSKKIFPKGTITVDENQLFTPSAIEFLNDKNIRVVKSNKKKQDENNNDEKQTFETIFGGTLLNKPEHMTHLRGNVLVFKDHPVIKYRGTLDNLESEIIATQIRINELGYKSLVFDLEEIISLVRKLIKVQITGESIDNFEVMGLDSDMIREHSHHTTKHYGINHFLPSYKQGEIPALLNRLRTLTRKAELVAYDAFKDEYKNTQRNDIIKVLNRLSSVFWIMMCKFINGTYKKD